MGKFLTQEKKKQEQVKKTTNLFSSTAKADGIYKKRPRPFCVPVSHAEENVFQDIRQASIQYFAKHNIGWHDGKNQMPSNHLCDSQVCCVNFLFPFATQSEALKSLLLPIFPQIDKMLLIHGDDQYIGFEWIGVKNYLNEKARGKRTRGKNFTSADAIVRFQDTAGEIQIVLIEWKYTESYSKTSYAVSRRGTSRTAIYQPFYNQHDFPLDKSLLVNFAALFYEPFYQLLRQQLLANEMQKASEMNASRVSVLHIAPQANTDFQKVTSPNLAMHSNKVMEVWNKLVINKSAFRSIATEKLFTSQIAKSHSEFSDWWAYISTRYSWMNSQQS